MVKLAILEKSASFIRHEGSNPSLSAMLRLFYMDTPNLTYQHENDIVPSPEKFKLPFKQEGFYRLVEDGQVEEVGCEILLNLPNKDLDLPSPREFLDAENLPKEEILQRKEWALRNGIEEARNHSDKEMVSVNIDGDWATFNNVRRFFSDPANTLPANAIIELTEIKSIGNNPMAAEALIAIALEHEMLLFDDMPTEKSLDNMREMFRIMNKFAKIHYGVKVDFNYTHALLGRPMSGDPKEKYEEAMTGLRMLRELMDTCDIPPTWIIFEGLNYVDELEMLNEQFVQILDPRQKNQRAMILGQFFRDEVKKR